MRKPRQNMRPFCKKKDMAGVEDQIQACLDRLSAR